MEEELYGDLKMNESANTNSKNEVNISPEMLEQAKNYIENYKSQYPKESIQQGLVQIGITDEQAKQLIEKYW